MSDGAALSRRCAIAEGIGSVHMFGGWMDHQRRESLRNQYHERVL